jgi:precorrin-6Y C5,15-methyltransferase (decarboxylating)
MHTLTIIGIPDNEHHELPKQALEAIENATLFSGGKRHHELMNHLLPANHRWIDVTVPLSNIYSAYRQAIAEGQRIVVFASGDPLFYGLATTLKRELPDTQMKVIPWFNSLQTLAHRLTMPYHDMRVVSLTGRPWKEFDKALIEGATKIGVLTDRNNTPTTIAQRMMYYGYDGYVMHIGEHLGNEEKECITTLTLKDAAGREFSQPNCLILCGQQPLRSKTEKGWETLPNRPLMITKDAIRTLSLKAMDLKEHHVMWDIGFCTGSVSIEARLTYPHLDIVAFEVREECKDIMERNARTHGAMEIAVEMGDFLQQDLSSHPSPDAVFIGGHGGKLIDIMKRVNEKLADGGVIVMNSVTAESARMFGEACELLGYKQDTPMRIALDNYNPITILKATK